MSIRFTLKTTGVLLTVLLLASCGQKGPLYIQEDIQQNQEKVSEPVSEPLSQETEQPVKQ